MNALEFAQWAADVSRRWPTVGGWMRENTPTLDVWLEELFADLTLGDCLAANRELTQQGESVKFDSERDGFGGRIRRMAKALEFQRETKQREREERSRQAAPHILGSMGKALTVAAKLPPGPERLAAIGRELPPSSDQHEQRWYCLTCRDSGLVKCYHPETVQHAWQHLRGQRDRFTIYTVEAACDCAAGDKHANHQQKPIGRIHGLFTVTATGRDAQRAELAKIAGNWEPKRRPVEQQDFF